MVRRFLTYKTVTGALVLGTGMTCFFSTKPTHASTAVAKCTYANQGYSEGACVNGQMCRADGTWGAPGSC
jgi:hypothetical protein